MDRDGMRVSGRERGREGERERGRERKEQMGRKKQTFDYLTYLIQYQ